MMQLKTEPIRPRAASIVAVVWLYLGGSWLLLVLLMLPFLLWMLSVVGGALLWMLMFWCVVAGIAIVALRGALGLLRLRERGRSLLERANWATFGLLTLFTLHFCSIFASVPSWFGETRFDAPRAVLPFFTGMLTTLPFLLMARALRSDEVRYAVRDAEARRLLDD